MKHQHRWTFWHSAPDAIERGWLSPGTPEHGYTRKCIGPAGGCGLVETKRILDVEVVTQSNL